MACIVISVGGQEVEGKFIRMPIGVSPETHEWLRAVAFRRRTTMAEIVREALREYRDHHEPQLGLPFTTPR